VTEEASYVGGTKILCIVKNVTTLQKVQNIELIGDCGEEFAAHRFS
jgi:hypothetical protein